MADDQGSATPSRATTRPRLTTVRRPGRCATASAMVSASTRTRSPQHPGGQPVALQTQRLRTPYSDHVRVLSESSSSTPEVVALPYSTSPSPACQRYPYVPQVSRIPSRSSAYCTQPAPGASSGGTAREAEAVVMIEIRASASAAISGSTTDASDIPRQNAWLTHNLSLHSEGGCSLDDHSSIENAPISMRVHADGYPRRAPNLSARLKTMSRWPFGSRSIAHGSSPPTVSSAMPQRPLQQFHCSGPHQQPTLRERDEVDIHDTSKRLSRRHHTLNAGHATRRVHVHVAADEGAALRDRKERLTLGLSPRIDRLANALRTFRSFLDLVDQARPHRIGGAQGRPSSDLSRCVWAPPDPAVLCVRHHPGQARRPGPGRVQCALPGSEYPREHPQAGGRRGQKDPQPSSIPNPHGSANSHLVLARLRCVRPSRRVAYIVG